MSHYRRLSPVANSRSLVSRLPAFGAAGGLREAVKTTSTHSRINHRPEGRCKYETQDGA
jgi:hypothetical protein